MSHDEKPPSRRSFLKTVGVVGAGSLLAGAGQSLGAASPALAAGGRVPRRPFGKTGVEVATLSLGGTTDMRTNHLLMAQLSFSITNIRWKAFLVAHIPALLLAALIFGEVWLIASTLRGLAAPAVIVLLISVGLVATIHTALVFAAPRLMLGADGKWMVDTLIDFFAMKLNRSGKGIEVNAE